MFKYTFIYSFKILFLLMFIASRVVLLECAIKDEVNKVKEEDAGVFFIDGPKDRENVVEGSGDGSPNPINGRGNDDEDDDNDDEKPINSKNDKTDDDIDFSGHGPPNEKDEDEDEDEEIEEGSGDGNWKPIEPDQNEDHLKPPSSQDESKRKRPNEISSTTESKVLIDGNSNSLYPESSTTFSVIDSDNDAGDDDEGDNDDEDEDDEDEEDGLEESFEEDERDENNLSNEVHILNRKQVQKATSFFAQPDILAAVIGGTVLGLLCAILATMLIVYRMRKKDEGSYIVEDSKPERSDSLRRHPIDTCKKRDHMSGMNLLLRP